MRELLVDYGLQISKQRKKFTLKESAAKADVDAFAEGMHTGPSLDNLQMDWTQPMTSLWNSSAIYLLAKFILERISNNHYPAIQHENWMTESRFFDNLKEKLSSSRDEYERTSHPDASGYGTDVDQAERRARLIAYKNRKTI